MLFYLPESLSAVNKKPEISPGLKYDAGSSPAPFARLDFIY
jgi:hypothetical protein